MAARASSNTVIAFPVSIIGVLKKKVKTHFAPPIAIQFRIRFALHIVQERWPSIVATTRQTRLVDHLVIVLLVAIERKHDQHSREKKKYENHRPISDSIKTRQIVARKNYSEPSSK